MVYEFRVENMAYSEKSLNNLERNTAMFVAITIAVVVIGLILLRRLVDNGCSTIDSIWQQMDEETAHNKEQHDISKAV